MSKKTDLPSVAPRFGEGEWMTAAVTVILCAISALALAYHIYEAAPAHPAGAGALGLHGPVRPLCLRDGPCSHDARNSPRDGP